MKKLSWLMLGLGLIAAGSCAKRQPLPPLPPWALRDVPADSVESVVFWIGDAGAAEWSSNALLHRLAADIDQWSRLVDRDSSVAVVYLGDNVYPGGLRDAGRPEFWPDSSHLEAQVDVMRAPGTRSNKSFAVFIPGNHDWGHKFGAEGERRLLNMQEFLDRRRATGIKVSLLPRGGTPGPAVIDIGRYTRIIILDTAWWLLAPNTPEKNKLMDELLIAMTTAGDRAVTIAAHHPYKSASSHGGLQPFWKSLGIRWLLTRSGAALQDLNSLPYRDLLDRMKVIFERTGPPLMFAGGHDHVLQVIKGTEKLDPPFMIVSGAGSKLSKVGHIDGMVYRGEAPGYMRMVVKKNGSIDLFVVSAPTTFKDCQRGDAALTAQCVNAAVQSFRNVYGTTLR
jgi:hypothetical protein